MWRRVRWSGLSSIICMGVVLTALAEEPKRVEKINTWRLEKTPQTAAQQQLRTVYDDGFFLAGTDDTLKIGGWLQADVRIHEKGHPQVTRFLARRARIDLRGTLEHDYSYRLMGEFEGATAGSENTANLKEGWIEYSRFPAFRVRVGQFKEPFSLESQYSALWLDFVEQSIGVANLQPAEDLGLMFFGKFWQGRVEYGAGIFNGMATNIIEANDDKDVAARVVLTPFAPHRSIWLKGLHLGGSLTYGKQNSALDGTGFQTAGGTRFFTYVNPTAGTDVNFNDYRWRAGGDIEWDIGPVSLKGEYLYSQLRNVTAGTAQHQNLQAWIAQAAWLMTGETRVPNKAVVPKRSCDRHSRGAGAWELVARYEQFRTDASLLANGFATGTDKIWAVTGGVNWWPNAHARVMLNFEHTGFDDALASIGQHENVGFVRFQYNF